MPAFMVKEFLMKDGYDVEVPQYFARQIKEHKVKSNPIISAVYLLIRDSKVLYVGQTVDLLSRLESHHYGFGADIWYVQVPDEQLKNVERRLIRKFKPEYNGGCKKQIKEVTLNEIESL